jgi:hypothetical protein
MSFGTKVARATTAAMLAVAAVVSTVVPLPLPALARLLRRLDEHAEVQPTSE